MLNQAWLSQSSPKTSAHCKGYWFGKEKETLRPLFFSGDVIQSTGGTDGTDGTDGIIGIGSGGNYAIAAVRALVQHSDLSAEAIVKEALTIAGGIDIYTNTNIVVQTLAKEPSRVHPQ